MTEFPLPTGIDCNSTGFWPNPCVSNFPIYTSNDWGFYVSLLFFLALCVTALATFLKLFLYRNVFPVSLIPWALYGATTLSNPLAFFALAHPMIVPSMPCWLHVLLCNYMYLP